MAGSKTGTPKTVSGADSIHSKGVYPCRQYESQIKEANRIPLNCRRTAADRMLGGLHYAGSVPDDI